MTESDPRVSVVIATYQRQQSVRQLIRQLCRQSIPPNDYEIVVVDDGSSNPVRESLVDLQAPCRLTLVAQENQGAASARDRGARLAKGDVLVMLDDDMRVGPRFLEGHLRHHGLEPTVVLGRILPQGSVSTMPVFERFHAAQLADLYEAMESGTERPKGAFLYTGNVSMRRMDYLAVGGFDRELQLSEDRELGLRLEANGARFVLATGDADSIHASDHTSSAGWLERAWRYGVQDLRISKKHPERRDADPWSFLSAVAAVAIPAYVVAALRPQAARAGGRLALRLARVSDALGLEAPALTAATASYGMMYFGGLGAESGGVLSATRGLARYLARSRFPLVERWLRAVEEDHARVRWYRRRYNGELIPPEAMGRHVIEKVGLQMMGWVRLMQLLREDGRIGEAKLISRLLRHLYGSDIHWDARFAPGVVIVHGMGLCIGAQAEVGPGCILFQNVTLGEGVDPVTRTVGAPILERDVHVGPGVTITGPTRVGAKSKIMAGALVDTSVPPGSLVRPRSPKVERRPRRAKFESRAGSEREDGPRA